MSLGRLAVLVSGVPVQAKQFPALFSSVDPPMRKIGTVETRVAAQRFCDFLVTRGIESSLDPTDPARPDAVQAMWIKDETKVSQARELLSEFISNPSDARYAVDGTAAKMRAEQEALNRKRLRAQQGMAPTMRRSASVQRPVTVLVLLGICITLGVLTNFGNPTPRISRDGRMVASTEATALDLLSFRSDDDAKNSSDAFVSIKKGQWWRLLTPAFLHGNIGHLTVNMFCIFSIGSVLERIEGRRFMILLILFAALVGNVVQVLWPESNGGGPMFVGASGIGYGMFGYVWMRPLYDDRFPIGIPPVFLIFGLLFILLGIANVIHGIANGAHVGGLVAGMVLAALGKRANKGTAK